MVASLSAPNPLPLLLLVVLALAWIVWLWTQPRRLAHRRRRLQSAPFPEAWERILRRRVPLTRSMPADLQAQLNDDQGRTVDIARHYFDASSSELIRPFLEIFPLARS